MIRVFFGVPGSYGNTGKKYWALMGLSGKDQEVARAPPKPSPNWTRGLGRGLPLPPSPSWTRKEGVLLPVGVGLPLARPPWQANPSPLAPLYTGAGGTP